MTKIALLNDTHFGVRGDSLVFLEQQKAFFERIFFPYLDQHNIKTVFHLGDTFDRRKFINFQTLEMSKQFFFNNISKRSIDYHMVLGNHDVYFTNTNDINSVSLVLGEYNFNIYQNECKSLKYDDVQFLLCPWISKDNKDVVLQQIASSDADVLLGHFEIAGFEMMKGIVCEHGLERSMFSKYESVYSGHFHHPSQLGNIKYLGAQYEMTWTDYNGQRGFHVYDTENRTLTFVNNPYKMFHILEYDDADLSIKDLEDLDTSMLKNCFIRIRAKVKDNPYLFSLFVDKINDSGAADVKVVEDTTEIYDLINTPLSEDETKDTKTIINQYVLNLDTQADKKKILTTVNNLYTHAMSL